MNLLLDTHAFIWFAQNSAKLSAAGRGAILAATNKVHVSPATAYEIALKANLGKLEFRLDAASVAEVVNEFAFAPLPITLEHAERAGRLDFGHRDPFDRLIAAQCLSEGLPLITADSMFRRFGVEILW